MNKPIYYRLSSCPHLIFTTLDKVKKDTTIAEQIKLDEIQTERENILTHIAQLQEKLRLLG